ncbi:MAG TPA: Rid family hydrolase, partial [Candidatus Sumerlaeota bacterium]|nr:Rid family hydrolase [Candidatus Sumerlaeota bacterium]
ASAIGTCGPGLQLYALAAKEPAVQIENPRQVSAFHYPRQYGRRSPSFSRAVLKAWGEGREHLYISGTASIDHRGEILHPGNVLRQFDRTIENIGALLEQAGATIADMSLFIVYVRDPADAAKARDEMRLRFGDAPVVAVTAPVCRPGWLIEVEGQAIVPISDPSLPEF